MTIVIYKIKKKKNYDKLWIFSYFNYLTTIFFCSLIVIINIFTALIEVESADFMQLVTMYVLVLILSFLYSFNEKASSALKRSFASVFT